MTRLTVSALALLFASSAALAQEVVSAKAGLIHWVEGDVSVDGSPVEQVSRTKLFSQFPQVKDGQVLSTAAGRAEMLLSPGVVLRVGEDSAVRMVSSKLSGTVVELQEGVIVLEIAELLEGNEVKLLYKNTTVVPSRTGMYRMGGDPAELMVYDGRADVTAGGQTITLKRGKAVDLGNTLVARKFDVERGDSLLRWSVRRAGYLARANISAAKIMYDRDYSMSSSGWYWNPYFGMYTYIPFRSAYCSSFTGYCFYSPARVYRAFYQPQPVTGWGGGVQGPGVGGGPRYSYDSNVGYTVSTSRTGDGYANAPAMGPAAASAPAVSEPARSGGDAGGRGGEGGGRSQ